MFPPRRRKREAEDSLLNSVDAVATEEERPVLRRIAALGSAMWKPECQAEIFCQVISLNYNICTRYIAVFIYEFEFNSLSPDGPVGPTAGGQQRAKNVCSHGDPHS